ncbi:hypothetical protein Cgig2_033950 [Carnegiea gigantea]|uniref:Uncharacterized protein n=1 Tax=Carnegiea gigantea TaxID=171969 RepID=A0A9Q1QH13_9CARY|nr:hypothetical protein Cgig2_033950 [Carnegiea gigantea]
MLVAVEGESDVKVIFKGNDEHGYLYESAAIRKGRVRDCRDGKLLGTSGRTGNDGVQVGRERGNNQARCRSLGSEGRELPASRLRLGGDTMELSDDDEISIVSKDAGDEETTKEDDAGDEQPAKKRCDSGSKRKGSTDGNDVNDNRKLGKKMDKHKHEILKWKNGVGERIELADTYKKMSCIAAVECYSLMFDKYSVELTNSRKLVAKLGQ